MDENKAPEVSVIMPVYNAEKYLRESIDSIRNQTFTDWELILVDDGSHDSSPDICDEYSAKDIRIKTIHKKNEGVAIARKTGCEEASGGRVSFVDSDDTLDNTCLEKCLNLHNKYDVDILVFGSIWQNEKTGEKTIHCTPYEGYFNKDRIKKEIFPALIQNEKAEYYPQSLCFSIYKKKSLYPYMIADSRATVGEDGACTIPAVYHATSIYFYNEPFYYYRANCESVTRGHRVFNWDYPEVTARHIESNINIEVIDFKDQLYRRLCHDVFNVCVSRFYSGQRYNEIITEIKQNLKREIYNNAISKARFRGSLKAALMMLALRTRSTSLMYLYSRISK